MQIGFIGLGAVVETAYLPALRRLGDVIDRCQGYDLDCSRALPGIQRCSSLSALLAEPLDTLFITTSSLQHLPVLERALASGISRIVVEKPIVANLEQAALNFATGELDTRQLRHPDGVILDIGTHVLAMLRETLHASGSDTALSLSLRVAKDRLGHDIAPGDTSTAEGVAHLQGTLGTIPLNIWLNKYAGPAGGQKGMRIGLRDGRVITLDRAPEGEVVTLQDGERVQRWTRPGAIYTHCLDEQILGADNLFIRAPDSVAGLTQRRLEEVEWLLRLQQQLRGPH